MPDLKFHHGEGSETRVFSFNPRWKYNPLRCSWEFLPWIVYDTPCLQVAQISDSNYFSKLLEIFNGSINKPDQVRKNQEDLKLLLLTLSYEGFEASKSPDVETSLQTKYAKESTFRHRVEHLEIIHFRV